jgi:hypothetical protein
MAAKAKESEKKSSKGKTLTDELFDVLNPNNVLSNAQRILSSAVNVLEEEIAAGILAAKKIEKKVIDVEEIRDNPEDLMNRIRRDTHEAVDLFMDAFTALSKQLGFLSDKISKDTDPLKKAGPEANEKVWENKVTLIENEESLKAGQTTVLLMSLTNDNATGPIKIQLQKTDLTGPAKQIINSRFIQLKPSAFILNPGEEKQISIQIKLPVHCKPGHYSALIKDAENPSIQSVLAIKVV